MNKFVKTYNLIYKNNPMHNGKLLNFILKNLKDRLNEYKILTNFILDPLY